MNVYIPLYHKTLVHVGADMGDNSCCIARLVSALVVVKRGRKITNEQSLFCSIDWGALGVLLRSRRSPPLSHAVYLTQF